VIKRFSSWACFSRFLGDTFVPRGSLANAARSGAAVLRIDLRNRRPDDDAGVATSAERSAEQVLRILLLSCQKILG